MIDDSLQTNTARHKRKLKLKDMALRESRDPQDFIDMPEPMDNKRYNQDPQAKDAKGKGTSRNFQPGEKRIKIQKESSSTALHKIKMEKAKKIRKIIRERSESYVSTRDSTPVPTTPPVEGTPEGSPPRQRRPPESNISSPSGGPRPRPFICEIEDCGKRFVDALQLERHIERHGPKELECDLDMCGKLFSSIMLLRRHQSMVHKRRSEKWESPPGTTRQRSGRSRRKEPRIVASGDIMDPAELEELPRDTMEVDDEDAEGDDARGEHDDNEGGPSPTRLGRRYGEAKGDAKHLKTAYHVKEPKLYKEAKIKDSKQLKERKALKAYAPKKLAPRGENADGQDDDRAPGSETGDLSSNAAPSPSGPAQPRPRPFHCTYDDCKKVFIDATQLERHLERHGPKELECGIDGCRKRFSAQMLLRRHQSMVHKRRSPAVNVSATTGSRQVRPPAGSIPSSRLAAPPLDAASLAASSGGNGGYTPSPSSSYGRGQGLGAGPSSSSLGYQSKHDVQASKSPPPSHQADHRQHHTQYSTSSQP
ncbi:hypothetical protein FBU30_005428 [Linnemannia zychae]|nr:hypothetical protein FBU30_005428 [Linnemannia zychae]